MHLHLHLPTLYSLYCILVNKKTTNNTIFHSRGRLPQVAPRINLEQGRFFISKTEFSTRIVTVGTDLQRIKDFVDLKSYHTKFNYAVKKYHKIISRDLIYEDIQVFVDFLSQFLEKKFIINPFSMFKKFPYEFLLLFDLCREA